MSAPLPRDVRSEKGIITSLATEEGLWKYARDLRPEHFSDRDARSAFERMRMLKREGRSWLEEEAYELGWLMMGEPAFISQQFEELVRRVKDAFVCRDAMIYASEVGKAAASLDPEGVERAISGYRPPTRMDGGRSIAEIAGDLYDVIGKTDEEIVGTGLRALDKVGALRRRESLGLAARPSMGKSQLAGQMALGNVKQGGVALVWSGEMSEQEFGQRLAGVEAGVAFREVGSDVDARKVAQALSQLTTIDRLLIMDQPMTSLQLWSAARKVADQFGRLDIVVCDHIRLMGDQGDAERHRLGAITRNLREIGKELDCAVIQCIQLNRAVEGRDDKRPGLSDLRDSGEIEENIDVASFIYRDGYYQARENGGSQSGPAEVYAKKNRNGKLWGAGMYFDAEHGPRFVDYTGQRP